MPTKRQQIAALMDGHPRLEVQYFARGEHYECRSPCWEFREIFTRRKTASFTSPGKALAYAQRQQAPPCGSAWGGNVIGTLMEW